MGGSVRTFEYKRETGAGFGLVEVMVAMAVLLVGLGAMLNLFLMAAGLNANQGEVAKRVTEYAQDKMEQLLALQYQDQLTDTTVFPAVAGVACPTTCGLTPGGGLNPDAPVVGYSDYVDKSGNPVAAGANWQYVRVWQITENVALKLKTITVVTQVRSQIGGYQRALLPRSTVSCLKSSPF